MSDHPEPQGDPHSPRTFSVPPGLNPEGEEAFVQAIRAYARRLANELDNEPTHGGMRGDPEVSRAVRRLATLESSTLVSAAGASPRAAEGSDVVGDAVRQAAIAATVSIGGYLIPSLGGGLLSLSAYVFAQILVVTVVFVRRH